MDNQNLRAFLLVAETGSFSGAAAKLHLTQPAVSKRVALLEDELDAALFDRIGRNVTLTEAGEALLPHAKAVEQQLEAAVQSVRDLSGETQGQLRLATSHHIGLHRLPPVLSTFSNEYPQVHIDIDFMDSEQAYELIHQGKAELAVVTLSPQAESNVVSIPVWQDPLDFMIARDHPLLTRVNAPSLQAMSEYPAILPGLNTYTGQIIKSLFDSHELELQVSMATNYLETIRMLASVGLGWTILPRSMRDATLARLEVQEINIERTLGLVYHEGRSLSRAARAFINAVRARGDDLTASQRPTSP
ncbi:LysR family transcriptional regulator [Halioglobus maricola]|uniref:LysR family transcriptional regulator n=1 Tax=Halioglobus maricola TaxID=2601894 RepID=A0A5P9NK39_9GAMM|nr:LysR family transcriptional regulator [Halioglobus maricola]QFU76200.1 LysR family transcriptional regulator [Halioglobus maricola]